MTHSNADLPMLLEAFKRALYAEDASKNTTSAYLSDLAHFVSWYAQSIGAFQIGEITPTDIRASREFLQEQIPPTAPATINRRLAALRRFFSWAKENHLTESLPMDRNPWIASSSIVSNEVLSKPKGRRGYGTAVLSSCSITLDCAPVNWRHSS